MSIQKYSIKCPECGFLTDVSWKNNRGKPRFCRHCGAQIAEPRDLTRYEDVPVLRLKCRHPDLCSYPMDCRRDDQCCIGCNSLGIKDTSSALYCEMMCKEAEVWGDWPPEEELEICEDLEVVIEEVSQ